MHYREAQYLWLPFLFAWCTPTFAQSPPAPSAPMPPLLYIKLIGPSGMKATFFRGAAAGQTFDVPCTIAVRPGYMIRAGLSGIGTNPGTVFLATLDIRGSLHFSPNVRNADFPAALVFRHDEFARAKHDSLVTKVIVLEKPDSAVPIATRPDEPLEITAASEREALREASERGQALVIVQFGGKEPGRLELTNVPGTVLLPGEKVLPPPQLPPCVPWNCFPVIDPRAGPLDPGDFVRVPDGGDVGFPAGFNREEKLRGLDPSDTVAEYRDSRGTKRLAVSNRIALCIPRFVVVKSETALAGQVVVAGTSGMKAVNRFSDLATSQPLLNYLQREQLEGLGSNQKASGTFQIVGPAITGRIDNLIVVGTVTGTKDIDASHKPATPEPADGPLLIIKWPDRHGALVGDIVTFSLKYTNSGGQPISDIVVADSLTSRFEYIAGTAKTDREAIFTTQANEAGSQILRWQITGTLEPHSSGVVTFQVRVR